MIVEKGARDVRISEDSFDEVGVRMAASDVIDVRSGAADFIRVLSERLVVDC